MRARWMYLLWMIAGCDGSGGAPRPDVATDASGPGAGRRDAAARDAAPPDAARSDTGGSDAARRDAARADAAARDAARPDAAARDAARPDAAADDGGAGFPDGAVVDGRESGGVAIGFDPERNDAVTAYGQCAQLVLDCVAERGAADDVCVEGVRVCETDRPWEEDEWCCAQACVDRYRQRRALGDEPLTAMIAVFRDGRDCMPGVPPVEGAP